jgi:hypothetical protein
MLAHKSEFLDINILYKYQHKVYLCPIETHFHVAKRSNISYVPKKKNWRPFRYVKHSRGECRGF